MQAMTPKELEAFRDMTSQGESAAELFKIMSGKNAVYVGNGKVEIDFPVSNYSSFKVEKETIRVGAEYLIINMNSFIDGRYP
jgi:hypothetical protein